MAEIKFTYDGDPSSSPVNEVRFYIGDTVRQRPMFTDTEIEFQISKTPNLLLAGAELLEIKARQFARLANETVDGVSKNYSDLSKQMMSVAKDLRKDARRGVLPFFGGLTKTGKKTLRDDTNAVQPWSTIGLADDPAAVQLNDQQPRRIPEDS